MTYLPVTHKVYYETSATPLGGLAALPDSHNFRISAIEL